MGIELLERAVNGGGQLLRVEAAPVAGRADRVEALLLTFDLGRIAVTAEIETGALQIEYLASQALAPQGLSDIGEEDPWWRVLGNPIARVWPLGSEHFGSEQNGAVCLQFRADDQSPRIVSLAPRSGAVVIRLEDPPS